jgi:hypothetical protein
MARVKHAVVRTDRLAGTVLPSSLVSLKYLPAGTPTAIENGNVVLVTNTLVAGEREVFEAVTPAANSPRNNIALVATPEVMYDERMNLLTDFFNEADAVIRGYRLLFPHEVFSVTEEAVDGTAAVGNIIELQAGTKLKAVASLTAGSTQIGTVIDISQGYIAVKLV